MNAQSYLADKTKTWELFDKKVSKHYDMLSNVLSLGLYRTWHTAMAENLPDGQKLKVLDLATGTGLIPLAILETCPDRIEKIVGVDLSSEMLEVFSDRMVGHPHAKKVSVKHGDATALKLKAGQFDAVTMALGIRNVGDHHKGCDEIFRMLKPGGRAIFLEPSMPSNPLLKQIYLGYFGHVVPVMASVVSNYSAYKYFSESVRAFMHGDEFLEFLESHGFEKCRQIDLTLGAMKLYIAERPAN